jgi:predicted small lipoprotein YifL
MIRGKHSIVAVLVAAFLILAGCSTAGPLPPAPYEGDPRPINVTVPTEFQEGRS